MNDYRTENDAERTQLFALLDGLSEADLQRTLPNGWTVAAALGHLAFWDRYATALLNEWGRKGFHPPAAELDATNKAIESMSAVIPPAALLAWVRQSAEVADRTAYSVSPQLVQTLEEVGKSNFLFRSKHRRHHLDQIEALLGA